MIAGICEICGKVGKVYTCSLCGKNVCPQHYALEKGTCMLCRKGLR